MRCSHHQNCIDAAIHTAEVVFDERGLRLTELRRQILTSIWASHRPAKAYGILESLHQQGLTIKPAALYRILDVFLAQGLVHKLSNSTYIGCSHPQRCGRCSFLLCTQCHEVEEYCALAGDVLNATMAQGFVPADVTIEVRGLCRWCQQNESP